MARKKHLINVHTSTGTTEPTNASLYLGEIAVQHTPNDPALWIKVGSDESSTDYEKFIGETEIIELIDNSEIILGSGYTYTGLPYVNSATTIANAYSALTKEMIDNETVVAAALNDLNGRVIELSGNTGGAETDPIFSSSVAAGITQTDIDNWNAAASGGSTDPNAITGITMNGNAVSVSNRIAGLGTVITAETRLSKGTTTGTGNVVTDLSVNNHQITLAKSFSAAPADQFVTLSGAAHNKITALSAGTISVSGFAHNKITALSAATTAHTADTTVHITAAERTAWNNKVSNVQADWSTTATTDGSYIKNKPTIPTVPTSNTAFTNDAGYITGYTETDPTVSAWAKAANKPTYTASEVGAQETLVSGTNIKTINNESLLGSGNITISAETPLTVEVGFERDETTGDDRPVIVSGTYAEIKAALIAGRHVVMKVTQDNEIGYAQYSSFDDVTSDYSSPFVFKMRPNNETVWEFVWFRQDNLLLRWGGTSLSVSVNGQEVGQYSPELYEDSYEQEYQSIDISVPTKTSDLTNDSGFISGYTETDPTVPAWAKAASKPSYTANEVGALPTGTTLDNVADGTTRKLSNYATTGTVNTLNNTVTAHTANTTIHVTTAQTAAWDGKQDAISDLATIRSNAAAGAAKVSNVQADWNATTGLAAILNKPTIPSAPGTLTTTATTAQSTATNEALTGSISLHKVSKTGSYDDLTNKPTIPTVPAWATASTKPTYTASEVGALPTGTTLDDIADGTTRKLSNYSLTSHTHDNYATTGDVNTLSSATQNIQSSAQTAYNNRITGGTITSGATNNVTVTNNSVAITAATIPSYSTADNGKVLMIQDGVPQWVIPSTITYSSSQPTGGNEGDIWIQTS